MFCAATITSEQPQAALNRAWQVRRVVLGSLVALARMHAAGEGQKVGLVELRSFSRHILVLFGWKCATYKVQLTAHLFFHQSHHLKKCPTPLSLSHG